MKVSLLALSGDRIAKTAQGIIPVCFKILHQLDTELIEESQQMKKELRMLVQQVMQRDPHLEADGFFEVNYNMLGFVISSFTSYIIVAVQFMLNL